MSVVALEKILSALAWDESFSVITGMQRSAARLIDAALA